ncbi:lonp-1 [Pristionchus pacificus]|uniref:Lon protease homolog n=1 Tax=Pristionchus pacificus TaxID=54126 RepID=A0A2A6BMS4_PRIPA|nr:lonp-1 [Pristionchus pacificus]|eukprot:PDM67272.1 AAA protein [Pristionchus pacificus]
MAMIVFAIRWEGKTPSGIVYAKTENFIHTPAPRTNETKAKMQAIVQTIRDVVSLNPLLGQQINLLLHPTSLVIENPVNLCDLIASVIQSADTSELQAIMEEPDVSRRLDLVLELAEKEKAVAKLKHDINKDVEKKVQEQHRKYLLGEQLKVIKKELGLEKDEKSSIGDMLDERISKIKPPEHVAKVIEEERSKLQTLEPHSAEFSVTRNYLDWLTSMPWGVESEEWRDLAKAREMLDKGHFGMEDVKQRILEFIAVNVLTKKEYESLNPRWTGQVGGKIICLHGPPGVGKTSIAKSIAAALNRKYFRFSVGGMTDVAEIKGHRRTYVGAMPGKVIQGLKKVGTENPLVLIDEVDKMGGAGYHGDPSSALLELLDPEQNAAFNDHFLDVPVDLSKVLFVCTANAIDRLPGPLRDRMELIDVSGYLAEEKTVIAQKHLIPQTRVETCISADQLEVEQSALDTLVKKYCRESGVRMLQQSIEKIFRKAALTIASAPEGTSVDKISVTSANISDYMGKEKFASDRLYELTPPGVVMGLAWTSMGGSALYVEAVAVPRGEKKEGGGVQITGNMGDVMKESVRIAQTVATKWLASHWSSSSWAEHRNEKPEEFFEKNRVHVHVPEGATPKDGPSAGVALVSALLSLAMKTPLRKDLAMTGEVSLTGKVLPVGGIREKVIAARRVGATTLVFPAGNRADVDALHELVKDSLTFHFVENYEEIVPIIFEDLCYVQRVVMSLILLEQARKDGNAAFGQGEYEKAASIYESALEEEEATRRMGEGETEVPTEGVIIEEIEIVQFCHSSHFAYIATWSEAVAAATAAIDSGAVQNEKALERRAHAYTRMENKEDDALNDYKALLVKCPGRADVAQRIRELERQIKERNEKLKDEMMGKLKQLGNMCLKPFGLSTDSFQMVPNGEGGYSIKMANGGDS